MESQRVKPILSAVFIDYDNIYLSLKRKSVVAARQFARAPGVWLRELEQGNLIASASSDRSGNVQRRIVMNRSYGNPVPRRNSADSGPDKDAFPFVRHHFLRAGCEIVDCPPLTAQLKNSSDIRMVMDIQDLLAHKTHFDEFIILSGDSDFTPLLHRLRAHARGTVVYVNDHTAMPYTAIADGEVREADLIALLEDSVETRADEVAAEELQAQQNSPDPDVRQAQQDAILQEVVAMIRASSGPVPIEALADRAQRALGKDVTAGANWAGFGNFRAFLTACLPIEFRLTTEQPFVVYQTDGASVPQAQAPQPSQAQSPQAQAPQSDAPVQERRPAGQNAQARTAAAPSSGLDLQQVIGRIQEACQAPPLSPPDYSSMFEMIAAEINENGLNGTQTLANIGARAAAARVTIHPTDVRFVLDVISEPDPWFEQGASASLFAARFRNFVVTRCRTQGMELSGEELELIDAWFAGATIGQPQQPQQPPQETSGAWNEPAPGTQIINSLPPLHSDAANDPQGASDEQRAAQNSEFAPPPVNPGVLGDLADMDVGQLPRIVRSRMRT